MALSTREEAKVDRIAEKLELSSADLDEIAGGNYYGTLSNNSAPVTKHGFLSKLDQMEDAHDAADTVSVETVTNTPQAPAARTAEAAPMATERQVDYIASLLVRRDSEGGFSGLVSGLHTNGKPNMTAIRSLTRKQASEVIDSLRETY